MPVGLSVEPTRRGQLVARGSYEYVYDVYEMTSAKLQMPNVRIINDSNFEFGIKNTPYVRVCVVLCPTRRFESTTRGVRRQGREEASTLYPRTFSCFTSVFARLPAVGGPVTSHRTIYSYVFVLVVRPTSATELAGCVVSNQQYPIIDSAMYLSAPKVPPVPRTALQADKLRSCSGERIWCCRPEGSPIYARLPVCLALCCALLRPHRAGGEGSGVDEIPPENEPPLLIPPRPPASEASANGAAHGGGGGCLLYTSDAADE